MKDADAKMSIAKELELGPGGNPLMDLETGAFKPRKMKKEKTREQTAASDLKMFEKKFCVVNPNNQTVYFF